MNVIYENVPAVAQRIGWDLLPEHCFGDSSLPYVEHDHVAGKFTYRKEAVCERCNILMTASGHRCGSCGMNV